MFFVKSTHSWQNHILHQSAKENSIISMDVFHRIARSWTQRRQRRIPELVKKIHNALAASNAPFLIGTATLHKPSWLTAQLHIAIPVHLKHSGLHKNLSIQSYNTHLLHFAWVVDHEKCIVVTRICVSVSLRVYPQPHAYTIARTRM